MREQRKQLIGRVTSNKMDKSVVVEVTRVSRHPLYGKVVRNHNRFMAHDEGNTCAIGDVVRIVEARPMSRRKRWAVEAILEHSEA
ncbi:MAG: 30S ribosomal protein S17 [Caldilineae bacterium]|nr:30S ribosomal protein S17 [Anaerolineae bacterium]MCB0198865.1 30S ribosomal protein S17 [Anaerolineae bacterium]MCB0203328.1 30S ribosomal protein S17 [Anaerolineae bacterium]MCB0252859.1 30S ribosomal protein S17 [Anaerolineae bacterium]MCB9153538.1 30S ribosomal protein S17 [Caldilineae bacterium]